jgi:hypothetical protein
MLVIGTGKDRLTPAAAVQPGWQDVADAVSNWLDRTSLPLPAGKRA